MPQVFHVSKKDLALGNFPSFENYQLIFIDSNLNSPVIASLKVQPSKTSIFCFLDIEQEDFEEFESMEKWAMGEKEGLAILDIFKECFDLDQSILVCCSIGIGRSSAIAKVAKIIGFDSENKESKAVSNRHIQSLLLSLILEDSVLYPKLKGSSAKLKSIQQAN